VVCVRCRLEPRSGAASLLYVEPFMAYYLEFVGASFGAIKGPPMSGRMYFPYATCPDILFHSRESSSPINAVYVHLRSAVCPSSFPSSTPGAALPRFLNSFPTIAWADPIDRTPRHICVENCLYLFSSRRHLILFLFCLFASA